MGAGMLQSLVSQGRWLEGQISEKHQQAIPCSYTCCSNQNLKDVCHNENLNGVKKKYKPWLVQTDFRNQLVER